MRHLFPVLILSLILSGYATKYTITTSTTSSFGSTIRALVAGDTLTFESGEYKASAGSGLGSYYYLTHNGTAENPIVVRAAQKNTVIIRAEYEWLTIQGAHWVFENIDFNNDIVTHVFHVKAGGQFFTVRNCHFYNLREAPIKMSSMDSANVPHPVPEDYASTYYSDYLLFENNESERIAGPYDADNLNGFNLNGSCYHVIRGNYCHDISKSDYAQFWNVNSAYGGFVKGGSKYCLFESNIFKNINGFGFSLGGGLTAGQYFRVGSYPHETFGCVVRNNVVVGYHDRNAGNRAFTINHGSYNLVYNNTFVNAAPFTVLGASYPTLPVAQRLAGIGNVIMNNLTVNLWNTDSLWCDIDPALCSSTFPNVLIVDGVQIIATWPPDLVRDQSLLRKNCCVNNLRMEVADVATIFWDTASNDFRLRPEAVDAIGKGLLVSQENIHIDTMLEVVADTMVAHNILSETLSEPMYDFLGNERPNPPSIGAFEAYDGAENNTTPYVNIEHSKELRSKFAQGTIQALVSPNPSGSVARIDYVLSRNLPHLEITIWDVRGRMVRNLFNGETPKGTYSRFWDGRDHEGNRLPPGSYLLRFRSQLNQFQTKFTIVH